MKTYSRECPRETEEGQEFFWGKVRLQVLVRNPIGKAEWTFGSIIHELIHRFR